MLQKENSVKTRPNRYTGVVVVLLLLIVSSISSFAQDYKLHVSNIEIPQQKETSWYGRPKFTNLTVHWELYTVDETGDPQLVDSNEIPQYRIYISRQDSNFSTHVTKDTLIDAAQNMTFARLKVGPRYYFRIDGLRDNQVVVQSDTAWVVSGKPVSSADFDDEEEIKKKFPFPLFFPLANILDSVLNLRNQIYHGSTVFGKLSFTIIWYFFLFCIGYLLPFRCIPNLRLERLFPFGKSSFWGRLATKERHYEESISPRFRFVIEAWKHVMIKTNMLVRQTGAEELEKVSQLFYEHFKTYGANALTLLKQLIEFDPDHDDMKELEEDLKKYFGKSQVFGDIMDEPIPISIGSRTIDLNWTDVKKDVKNSKNKEIDYPTIKILKGGLENHLINGFQWQTVSEEVDRAIENRAFSEIEALREKSSLDWFWNLGALAPLLGLLGTVTGISNVFFKIRELQDNVTHLELVKQLSSGIFEALWTTIYGLIVGILLVTVYYYYKNILDWIYVKWQAIFVHVTEKL